VTNTKIRSVYEVAKYGKTHIRYNFKISGELYIETLVLEVLDAAHFTVITWCYLKHMAVAKGDAGTAAAIHRKEVSLSVHEVDKFVTNQRTNCKSIQNLCSTYHSHF